MSPSQPIDRETWIRINELFHQALEKPEDERQAFLEAMCAGDVVVREEVESLMAAHARASDFIERPGTSVASLVDERSSRLPIPDRIGAYRILRLLGEGGMGVVYLAEDTRLGRTVALKSLAPRLVGDATGRERLRREARAAASLNHPGIATVYALEEIDQHLYIASEYVPGETLRDEIIRGPLDPRSAIDTATEIANALGAAHERGIVHRDLKPENVVRTPAGHVKILDFGLARMRDFSPEIALSADGAILGTPAYMSPEQIRAVPVDARADLFALGIMLYELLTGVHPFMAPDPASTLARVLESDPGRLLEYLPRSVPTAVAEPLEEIVLTCLRKAPEERFDSARELVIALDRARTVIGTLAAGTEWGRTTVPPRPITPLRTPSLPVTAPSNPVPLARWWWQFHQAASVVVYAVLLVPLWFGRLAVPRPFGTLLFATGLIGVIVASAVRLHLWFAAGLSDRGLTNWREQHRRSARWRRAGDILFVAALGVGGLVGILGPVVRPSSGPDPGWLGIVLLAAAAAIVVSFTLIEPTTAEAAFGDAPAG